jgi:prepilin-type N-terminal cleavage/methylation domain-containing protein
MKNIGPFNKQGFSIIELMIVIAILVICAIVLIPWIIGSIDNSNLRRVADSFAGDINQLRQRALSESRMYRIIINGDNTYTMSQCPNAFVSPCDAAYVTIGTNSLVTGAAAPISSDTFPGNTIFLQTRGTVTNGQLALKNKRGSIVTIDVKITGRTSINVANQ